MKKILSIILTLALLTGITVLSHAEKLKGDVNEDGVVNSTDALMILQYTFYPARNLDKAVADLNGDGKINSADALLVLKICVGQFIDNIGKTETITSKTTTTTKKTTTTTKATTTTTKKTTTTTKATTTTTKKTTTTTKPTTTTTKKTTTTTKPTTTTIKKTTTTAKPTTTTTKKTTTKTYSCPYEVTPGTSVKLPSGLNAKHLRAWAVTKFSGLDIRISRLEYGSKVTRKFDATLNKQIVNPKTVTYTPACTVAVITCDKPTRLNVSKSEKMKSTEEDAKSVGAVIAIPGIKVSYYPEYTATIRSGSIYKKHTGKTAYGPQLIMYKNGKWEFGLLDNAAATKAVSNGAYNSLYIYDIILKDGVFCSNTNDKNTRNRTFLAQISETKYIFMTTEFMSIKDSADIMLKYGVKNAALIVGGNCTTMYLQGVGNTTNSTGASVKNNNKLGYYETEWFAKYGMLEGKKGGGPCTDELDCIYFK